MSRKNSRSQEQLREEFELLSTEVTRRGLLRGASGGLLMAGLGLPLLAACGTSTSDGKAAGSIKDALTPGAISKKYGNAALGDSWHSLELEIIADRAKGGKTAAQALGQTYQGISADLNSVKQLGDVQSAIAAHIDGINVFPIEATIVNGFAGRAEKAKVPFQISYNSPSWKTPMDYGDMYSGYFAPDDRKTGVLTATRLFEHLKGKGRVVSLRGVKGATADSLRAAGIQDALQKFPGIEIVAEIHTDWTTVDANKKMQNMLSSMSQIDGVIGADDDIGIGAYRAIRAAGKEIPIVSSDGIEEAFKLTASSFYLGTVNTFQGFVGGYLVARLFDVLHGWKPKPAERMMFLPTEFNDKTTAQGPLDRLFGETLPYNYPKMSRVLYPDDWDTQEQLRTIDPEYQWQDDEKPAGYVLPEGLDQASRAETDGLYDEHWITRS